MIASINGIRLQYVMQGPQGAPAVILIHGFPFNRRLWDSQVKELGRKFRVLSYDLRGMGRSSLGPAPQPLEAYVDDLLALMGHLGLAKAALCGLSMGGYIALRALQREEGRFWAVALCDTRADPDSDEGKLNRAAGIKTIRLKGSGAFAKAMLPKLLAPATFKSKPAVARALLKMMLSCKADGMANALSAMAGRGDTHEALRRFQGPLLALAGRHDGIAAPELAKAMAKEARQGKSVIIPQAGHVSNLENPRAFNKALGDFLSKAWREIHPGI
jgi:3-oxoadipate enol-lactonase